MGQNTYSKQRQKLLSKSIWDHRKMLLDKWNYICETRSVVQARWRLCLKLNIGRATLCFMATFKIMLCCVTIFGVHIVPAGGQTYLSTSALIS